MIWLYPKFRKMRKMSAPAPLFKSELRAEILRSVDATVVYRTTRLFRYALAPLSLALLLGVGTTSYAYASPSVCHGHLLYPLKAGVENMESTFYKTPEAQAQFQVKSLERRVDEVGYAMDHGRPTFIILKRVPDQYDQAAGHLRMIREVQRERAEAEKKSERAMQEKTAAVLKEFRAKVVAADLDDSEREEILKNIDERLEKIEAF